MLFRRESTETDSGPLPLILSVILHDSQDLAPELSDIPKFDIRMYANPWMAEGSVMAERLSLAIQAFSTEVADALGKVPPYDPAWYNLATDQLMEPFSRTGGDQASPGFDVPVRL